MPSLLHPSLPSPTVYFFPSPILLFSTTQKTSASILLTILLYIYPPYALPIRYLSLLFLPYIIYARFPIPTLIPSCFRSPLHTQNLLQNLTQFRHDIFFIHNANFRRQSHRHLFKHISYNVFSNVFKYFSHAPQILHTNTTALLTNTHPLTLHTIHYYLATCNFISSLQQQSH